MALSNPPPPHLTSSHNPNLPLETADSIFTLSIDSSRRIRRDVLLSAVSTTLIPQLFFFDRKRSSSANAADIFSFIGPEPEPERTVEIAQQKKSYCRRNLFTRNKGFRRIVFNLHNFKDSRPIKDGLRKNAENIKGIKEMMIENKKWKGGKELRRSASNMKQDLYLIIQSKPPKDRPLLRSLYSSLFNTITKLDYAARDGNATNVLEYYKSIDAILNDIFSRI